MGLNYPESERGNAPPTQALFSPPVDIPLRFGRWQTLEITQPSILIPQDIIFPYQLFGHHGRKVDDTGYLALQGQHGVLYFPKPGEWKILLTAVAEHYSGNGGLFRLYDANDPSAGRYIERKILNPVAGGIIPVDDLGVLIMPANPRRRYIYFQNVSLLATGLPDDTEVITVTPYANIGIYAGYTLYGFGSNYERDESLGDKTILGDWWAVCPPGMNGTIFVAEGE